MKKFLAIALALVLILSLAACGGTDGPRPAGSDSNQPGNSTTKAPGSDKTDGNSPGQDYASCYAFYSEMSNQLSSTITQIVQDNNSRLESENPDGYIQDPSFFMMFVYAPFLSLDMALTASVTDTVQPSAIAMVYSFFGIEDTKFSVLSPGNYKITYTTKDREDETKKKSVEEFMRYQDGSIRYEQHIDGELDEFYEFLSLGGDRYACQSRNARAIVTYKDGQIVEALHSDNMYEMDTNTRLLTDWSVVYDPEDDSAWGRRDLDKNWVLELESSGGLSRIYELKNGTLTIWGQKSKYDWQTGETSFETMAPVVIPVK